jgi:toxin ParE1/3/4
MCLHRKRRLIFVEIWHYIRGQTNTAIADHVGSVIRDRMVFLAQAPGAGHMRQDLTNEDVKFFPVYSYLIVYRPKTKPLHIVCILHGRRDVEQVLKGRL